MEEEKTNEARWDKETSAFFWKRERLSYGRTGQGRKAASLRSLEKTLK